MRLSDLHKAIIIAERDYRTLPDRLRFVNIRLKITWVDNKVSPPEVKFIPGQEKNLIQASKYHRHRNELYKKGIERAQQISKLFLSELVNEYDGLKEDRQDIHEIYLKAKSKLKFQSALRAKKLQMETGERITALGEQITEYMEEPRTETLTPEEEKDLEDNEEVPIST